MESVLQAIDEISTSDKQLKRRAKCKKKIPNKLLAILQISYPSTYRNMDQEEKRQTLSLYYDMFCEFPTPIIVQALKNYIKVNQYPPTIAGLQEQIDMIANKETPAELWNLVKKAICRSSYNSLEEFEKLPPSCQKWAGSHMTLKELSQVDIDNLNTVTRGQFLKTIESIRQKDIVQTMLPDNLRSEIAQLTSKMKMIEG